jgi:ABC-type antimicrobial peptide transport system permease subunit
MALGADRSDVLRLVVRRGLTLGAIGIAAGFVLVIVGGRFLAPVLYRVDADDPWTLGLAIVTCTLAAGLASLLPALRATRVAPAIALRTD